MPSKFILFQLFIAIATQSLTIPSKGGKVKVSIGANHRLALELATTKEVISAQNLPFCEKKYGLKAWVKKVVNQRWRPRYGCNDVNASVHC